MIRSLTSLRFVFILLIVLFHMVGQRFELGGDCGVAFFLMLSGFVLSYAYGQQVADGSFRILPFVKKQLAKFYPLHLLMLLAMVILDARLGLFYQWYQLLPSVLLIQTWFPVDSIIHVANASSWFLCALLFCYLLFPVLYRLCYGLPPTRLAVAILAVLLVYGWLVSLVPGWQVNNVVCLSPWLRIIDFGIGVLTSRLYRSTLGIAFGRRLQSLSPTPVTVVELLSVALIVGTFFVYGAVPLHIRCASLFWLPLPSVIFLFACLEHSGGWLTRLLHRPLLQRLGALGLEIYLTHELVIRLLNSLLHQFFAGRQHVFGFFVPFYVLAIVAVAYIARRWVVRPLQFKLIANY